MAGISYRDWVSATKTHSSDFDLTVTGGTAATSIDNIITPRLKEVTRFTAASNQIRLDFNSHADGTNPITGRNAMEVGLLYFGGIVADEGYFVTITVAMYDSSNTLIWTDTRTTNPHSRPWKYNEGDNIFFEMASIETDITRILVTINKSGGTRADIGRFWAGNWLDLKIETGWTVGPHSSGKVNFSRGLDAHPVATPNRRKGKFPVSTVDFETTFGDVDATNPVQQTDNIMDAAMWCGRGGDLIFIYRDGDPLSAAPSRQGIYGLLQKDMSISHQGGDLFETQIDILELV